MPKPCKNTGCANERQSWSNQRILCSFCGPVCAADHAKFKRDQKRAKIERKERKIAKERLKTRSDWIREVQTECNAYVRCRDEGLPCIACGTTNQNNSITGSSWDAGHYRSRGAAPGLRFYTINIWRVCTRCNRELSGNIVEMRKGMVRRLGEDRVRELEADNRLPKYTIDQLKELKRIFKAKTKLYRKLRAKGC